MFNFQSHKIFIFMNTYNNLEYTFIKTNTDHIIILLGNFYLFFFFFFFNLPIMYITYILFIQTHLKNLNKIKIKLL